MNDILPAKISAGLTFSKLVTLTCYPATGWQLSLSLRGPSVIDLAGVADGVQHKLEASADTTAAWTPGLYVYSARVSADGVVIEVDAGTVEILADVAQLPAGGDMRSHNRIVLENIRAVIEKRATQDQQRYLISTPNGPRELWRTPLKDLLLLEQTYLARVRAEDAAARGGNVFGREVRVRLK
ncbi:hypothetical protein [Bradyrhizobium sp. BWC-3-1]|uniref:hypothetical protein n=1 Tax=Bradyrhizobium sp. BWC-3-1 TaxID=3080012 RepID=UPI00293E7F35|nr:hypothetical protein [Bradyrhizobium sp. BWC-3-1]WOH61914.1 hypothetical protein RX329_18205 [Bradyrhizobium sp. BWC-3-1]